MQDLEVELAPTDKMLLDALMRIKQTVDDSVAYRRSCREGVCGSDAMNINGKNGLACITNLRDLKEPIVLKPLPGLPVIRDLIVDMTPILQAVRLDQALPDQRHAAAREGAAAVAGGPRRARRPVRVHPVRVLLDLVPVVLVEPGQVRRTRRAAAGLPVHRRQPRPGHQRATRRPGGSVPAVSLPHDHELRRCVPQGPEPDARDRKDQGPAGAPRGLTSGPARSTDCAAAPP